MKINTLKLFLIAMTAIFVCSASLRAENYGFEICGVAITSDNYQKITAIPGVKSGNVSYLPSTQTLTLENAVIESSKTAIWNDHVKALSIVLKGDNRVQADQSTAISSHLGTRLTIKGSGSLQATGKKADGLCGIQAWGDLNIIGCRVAAMGDVGIYSEGTIHIDNAEVKATGRTYGSIEGKSNVKFILTNGQITKPAGAVWNSHKKAVCDAGGVDAKAIKIEVVITAKGTNLPDFKSIGLSFFPNPVRDVLYIRPAEAVESIRIYNIYGAEVAHAEHSAAVSMAHLPAGVYSVRIATASGIAIQRVLKR